jgi:hypothetical protein
VLLLAGEVMANTGSVVSIVNVRVADVFTFVALSQQERLQL